MEAENRMIMNVNRNDLSTLYNQTTVDFERMKSEHERLLTYFTGQPWPVSFIDPRVCAEAGFFFLHDGDKVQCAFCRGVAGEWEQGDVPIIEHRRHFPRCPFICNLPVGNVPLDGETSGDEVVDPAELGVDVCGPYEPKDMHPGLFFRNGRAVGVQPLVGSVDDPATNLAIRTCTGPQNKSMVTVQARQKSFTERQWPANSGQTGEKMAEAGFYFLGSRDHVRCFYCGGGLCNWEARDDPWKEHARWFPSCTFVVLNKGEDFIRGISGENANARSRPPLENAYSSSDDEDVQVPAAQIAKPNRLETGSSCGEETHSSGSRSGPSSASSGNCSDEESEALSSGHDLEEEVRKLREARQCKICMDKEVAVVFLPCGHLVSCTSCATAFTNCALCRQPIRAVVRTYMS